MSDHEEPEEPRHRPKEIRASAIVRNLVKYYSAAPGSTTAKGDTKSKAQCHAAPDPSTSSFPSTETNLPETPPPIELPHDINFTATRHDPTLTALAQLGAFRLKTQRAVISLIDYEYQFVIAEGTQSVSLQDATKADPGDELWVGTVRLPAKWGLCPDTMHTFNCEDGSMDQSTDNITANQNCYVIGDLSSMECFQEKSYVAGPPYMRFYAEVPLRINGYLIGGYCVVDDIPRTGLDVAALDKLAEVASAITDHLELVLSQDRLQRSQEMIRALGRFADGKYARNCFKGVFDGQIQKLGQQKRNTKAQPKGLAQTMSTGSDPNKIKSNQDDSSQESDENPELQDQDLTEEENQPDSLAVSMPGTLRTLTEPRASRRATDLTFRDLSRSNTGGLVANALSKTAAPGDITRGALKLLFSRASHLIRQASDLHGIIFVDASLHDLAVAATKTKHSPHTKQVPRFSGAPETGGHRPAETTNAPQSSTAIIGGSIALPDILNPEFDNMIAAQRTGRRSPVCDLLGYAFQSVPGGFGIAPSAQQSSLPQSSLRGLLSRYPQGEVFLFNESGHLLDFDGDRDMRCCADTDDEDRLQFEREKEQMRAYQLLDICPGARAIIFFPLWDPQKDQWFAGSLAWTKDPTRLLSKEDVTLLSAFGSCIMAEKSKVDALNADRAKADFISSVSHELRSPLHGVLATTEFLIETRMDGEQEELMRTILGCGEVLLDTLDHILDYAKLNNSEQTKKHQTGKEIPRSVNRVGRVTTFDLGDLVEIVVEGMFAGHKHRQRQLPERGPGAERNIRDARQDATRLTPPAMNPNVMIIVDIEKQPSWVLESEIGSWKRILTNLIGNALKYTEGGFVRVVLQALPVKNDGKLSDSPMAIVLIEDSGIGMTKDFLKHRLYTPFSQANPHSVGTGLGLSIVRQLVTNLEGKIDISSELDYGTGARIAIPMTMSSTQQSEQLPTGRRAVIRDIAVWCKDLTICLIGFDYLPPLDEEPTGIATPHTRRMLAIQSSICNFATEWFGLRAISAPSIAAATGEIFIGVQSQIILSELETKQQPLIIFEDAHSGIRSPNGGGVFYLSQPVGPHKLARVLGLCLDYRTSALDSSSDEDNSTRSASVQNSSTPGRPSSPQESRNPSTLARDMATRARISRELAIRAPFPHPSPDLEPEVLVPIATNKLRSVVLLVEDNSVNMKILVNHMKRAKEERLSAYNGLEAVQLYQAAASSIKVIFMDIAMPIKDGIEATREIRQFEVENSLPRVRIVAVTCFSSNEYQQNAYTAGVDIFLVKPVSIKALRPILEMDPNVVEAP